MPFPVHALVRFSTLVAAASFTLATQAAAQDTTSATPKNAWQPVIRLDAEFQYDDNPFLLKTSKKANVANPSTNDLLSGRYTDMASATDEILVPQLVLGIRGPGMGGRDLEVRGEFGYEYNLQNTERQHADLGFLIQQSMAKGGRLRLSGGVATRGFQKNYLTAAVDGNLDGDITADERVYSSATVGRMDVSLAYRHRLMKGSKHRMGLTAEFKGFYSRKSFNALFPGRTLSGPGGELELAAEFSRRWTVSTAYSYERQNADATSEIVLLDETAFGQDVNLDGIQAPNARTVQSVDRSRREQSLGARLEGELGTTTTVTLGFSHRMRHFLSTGVYDVANHGRDDALNEFSAGFQVELGRRMQFEVAGVHGNQKTNRTGDPGAAADVTDYTRNQITTVLQYRF